MAKSPLVTLISRLAIRAILLFGIFSTLALMAGPVFASDILSYISSQRAPYKIYLMDVDHRLSTKLSDTPGVMSFFLSPDGQKIAFQNMDTANGGFQIYVTDIFGADVREIAEFYLVSGSLVWSPDSTQLVFSASIRPGETSNIFLVDVGSGAQQQLTENQGWNVYPDWSEDGQHIQFVSHQQGRYRIGVDGKDLQTVSTESSTDDERVWSPDGQQVAFMSHSTNHHEIHIMNADGSDSILVAESSGRILDAIAWSPDSRRIAYAVNRTGVGMYSIMMVNVDGSGTQILTPAYSNSTSPIFLPR